MKRRVHVDSKNKIGVAVVLLIIYLVCIFGLMQTTPPATTPNTTVETTQPNERVRVALTGDFLWEQGLYDWMDHYQFGTYFDKVKPYLQSDLTIANHEVPIGGEELGISGTEFTFNAPKQIAQQLPSIGINFATLANNHTLDMGLKGLNNTLQFLDEAGIAHTGAYRNSDDADKIKVVDVKGVKIAILAYTYDTNVPRIEGNHVSYFLSENLTFDATHREKLKADIKKAKAQSDLVFVAMHWGTEFTYELTETQKEVATFLNEQEVDLVIGNHPHTVQKAEQKTNANGYPTLVFYSLGNTVSSDVQVSRATPDFQVLYHIGALVNLDIVKKDSRYQFENVKIIPIVNHFEKGDTNYQLVPLKDYNQEMAAKHTQAIYNADFNYEWIKNQMKTVFSSSGLQLLDE
ncbi:CapA family protein [Carnobacteriaceae bacterium zg-ZUI252]|nr:CapA family protein [Carnobacteriaceae bacterium zg-ZUI252]MBS4770199.1 CapA family protein [Carnobacteriaceae bacterium zg-ZUI240]